MINGRSSGPGELPPQALTEPDVNLSVHPAHLTHCSSKTDTPSAQKGMDQFPGIFSASPMIAVCAYVVDPEKHINH